METLRTSSYMIPVKLEKEDDKYMLIHGYTGAMDIVGKDLVDYLNSKSTIKEETFPYSKTVLDKLIKRKYVTSKNRIEEYEYVQKLAFVLRRRALIRNFTILVTYNCNFQCPYCFEKDLIQKSNNDFKYAISSEMVDRIFNAIDTIEPNKQLRNNTISLFGGEPLLEENKNIVKYILTEGNKRGFSFTATTNGYDIDKYKEFLNENQIKGIQITIDGTKEIHDLRRIHAVYSSSFDRIIENIQLALNQGVYVRVRINVDNENVDTIRNLYVYFKENRFFSYKSFSAYVVLISGDLNFNPISYNNKDNIHSDVEYIKMFTSDSFPMEYETGLYKNVYNAMMQKKPLSLSPMHCTALGGSFVFDPFGYIYSCLEMVGKKEQ